MTISHSRDPLQDLVANAIRYAQTSEALLAAVGYVGPIADALGRCADVDDDLTPELRAALDHLEGLGDALKRAAQFVQTRYDVAYDRAMTTTMGDSDGS